MNFHFHFSILKKILFPARFYWSETCDPLFQRLVWRCVGAEVVRLCTLNGDSNIEELSRKWSKPSNGSLHVWNDTAGVCVSLCYCSCFFFWCLFAHTAMFFGNAWIIAYFFQIWSADAWCDMQVSKYTQPEGETSLRDFLFHQFHHRNLFFWDVLQGLSGAPGSMLHQLDEWKDISHQTA